MADNTVYFQYIKRALIGVLVIMIGFGLDYYLDLTFLSRVLMIGGILATWWYLIKAGREFYRNRITKQHS